MEAADVRMMEGPGARMWCRSWVAATVLVVSAGAAGCDGGAGAAPLPAMRDSAGITIVENPGPQESTAWIVEPEPILSVGVAEGDERYLLSRVADALLLPDGGVALLDGGSLQLRLYGPDGVFREAAGRQGSGPGEFRAMGGPLASDGDGGFLLWDPMQRRITHLGSDLSLRGTTLLEAPEGATGALLRGWLADGTMVVSEVRGAGSLVSGSTAFRDTLWLHRADAEGRHLGPMVAVPSTEGDIRVDGGPDPSTIRSIAIFRNPLSPAAHLATGELLVTGNGGAFELSAASPEGSRAWISRLDRRRRPLDAADREAYIESMAAASPDPAGTRAAYADRPFPTHFPTFDQLVLDSEGNAWMREYRAPFDDGDARWQVVDPQGVWRAEALLPGRLRVTRITGEVVVGIHRDDLDVESVRVYRRGAGG